MLSKLRAMVTKHRRPGCRLVITVGSAGLQLDPVAWSPIATDGPFVVRVDPWTDLRSDATEAVVHLQAWYKTTR